MYKKQKNKNTGKKTAGKKTAGKKTAGKKTAGKKTAGKKTTGNKSSGVNSSIEQTTTDTGIIIPFMESLYGIKTFRINSYTKLTKLGKDLINKSKKGDPEIIRLLIEDAKTFKVDEIEKLSSIISKIPTIITVEIKRDMDFTELLFLMLCHNFYSVIPKRLKISMSSQTPISNTDLERISKKLEKKVMIDADEISDYYKKKAVIFTDKILPNLKLV